MGHTAPWRPSPRVVAVIVRFLARTVASDGLAFLRSFARTRRSAAAACPPDRILRVRRRALRLPGSVRRHSAHDPLTLEAAGSLLPQSSSHADPLPGHPRSYVRGL